MTGVLRFALLLMMLLLAACGSAASAGTTVPTPTPLPPDPALERPVYRVERGVVEQFLDVTGRATPIDLRRLSFASAGRVTLIKVRRGDTVAAGDVLAELEMEATRDDLRLAELTLSQAQRDLERAQQQKDLAVRRAELSLEQARERGTATDIKIAELGLEEARLQGLNAQQAAVEMAQFQVEKAARAVDARQIVAPQAGQIVVVGVAEGETIEAFDPVVEIADPSRLEVAAELTAEQMRQLAEGQPATITLAANPDTPLAGTIRRLPAPYGAGGTGAVQEQDPTTRFNISDPQDITLTPGAVASIRIILARKENALWLPPGALRSFENRRFVIVRDGNRERRVSVSVGIQTDTQIEIVEGLEDGAEVIGP